MNDHTIYILGAGCSVNCGYPLAKSFCGALKEYLPTLDQRPNCERLRQCVGKTVSLIERFNSPTVDRLVLRILEELDLQKRALSPCEGTKHEELEQSADCQVLDAKIATVALFLEREDNARRTGLQRYRDFLNIIFDGNRDPDVLKTTSARVLSFNYERLFELAFIDYFRLNSNVDCYGPSWLNSGLDLTWKQAPRIAPDRFCFLKLHGTAGISVGERHGQPRYGCLDFIDCDRDMDDNFFWPRQRENCEPLLVFPCEKDRARESRTAFLQDDYIRLVWGQPGKSGYGEKLVQEATQIWVIGYSFDPNDRKSLMELLRKSTADCEIVVQNPDATGICAELCLRYSDLVRRLKPLSTLF